MYIDPVALGVDEVSCTILTVEKNDVGNVNIMAVPPVVTAIEALAAHRSFMPPKLT